MPPSYSMMLPGRMSTPLIFMSSLGECGKEPARSLAARLFPGKQRVWVDRRAVPPALAGRHAVDRKVQVRPGRARIPGMPDAGDHLAALHLLPFGKPGRIGRQVGVVIDPLLVRRSFVDRGPAAHAVEQFL